MITVVVALALLIALIDAHVRLGSLRMQVPRLRQETLNELGKGVSIAFFDGEQRSPMFAIGPGTSKTIKARAILNGQSIATGEVTVRSPGNSPSLSNYEMGVENITLSDIENDHEIRLARPDRIVDCFAKVDALRDSKGNNWAAPTSVIVESTCRGQMLEIRLRADDGQAISRLKKEYGSHAVLVIKWIVAFQK